jgi:DNA-binding transcriptional LysR family regulator
LTVELRDLKWALLVSQHRSLRQAAETLNIRQSTLSRRLRDLEDELGATLFVRTNGGTRPTLSGQEFLERARYIIEEIDTAVRRLRTRSRGENGPIIFISNGCSVAKYACVIALGFCRLWLQEMRISQARRALPNGIWLRGPAKRPHEFVLIGLIPMRGRIPWTLPCVPSSPPLAASSILL